MVPKGWEVKNLSQITDFIKDGTHGTHKRYESGIPMLSAKNITKKNTICFEGAPYISEKDYNKIHTNYTIKSGDILLTVVGTIGRVAIVPKELHKKFTFQRSVAIIRVLEDISNQYLMQLFSNNDFTRLLHRRSNSTAQAGIYLGELGKLKVLIPNTIEQQKIAKILTTWDNAIRTTERLIENSRQQKKALMQQLLTGKKRLLDDDGKRFAGEWLASNFEGLFKVANSKKTQVKSSDYLDEGSTPIIDQGKQLISGYTNGCEVYTNIPVIIFGDHTRIIKWIDFEFAQGADGTQVLKNTETLHAKFAYYLLSDTDIPNLGYSRHMRELKEKNFKYPIEKDEQQKIAAVLTNADKEIELLEQQLADLQQEKKALMQQLLTGKRRVVVDGE